MQPATRTNTLNCHFRERALYTRETRTRARTYMYTLYFAREDTRVDRENERTCWRNDETRKKRILKEVTADEILADIERKRRKKNKKEERN